MRTHDQAIFFSEIATLLWVEPDVEGLRFLKPDRTDPDFYQITVYLSGDRAIDRVISKMELENINMELSDYAKLIAGKFLRHLKS